MYNARMNKVFGAVLGALVGYNFGPKALGPIGSAAVAGGVGFLVAQKMGGDPSEKVAGALSKRQISRARELRQSQGSLKGNPRAQQVLQQARSVRQDRQQSATSQPDYGRPGKPPPGHRDLGKPGYGWQGGQTAPQPFQPDSMPTNPNQLQQYARALHTATGQPYRVAQPTVYPPLVRPFPTQSYGVDDD